MRMAEQKNRLGLCPRTDERDTFLHENDPGRRGEND
jgi:hypothetical protein